MLINFGAVKTKEGFLKEGLLADHRLVDDNKIKLVRCRHKGDGYEVGILVVPAAAPKVNSYTVRVAELMSDEEGWEKYGILQEAPNEEAVEQIVATIDPVAATIVTESYYTIDEIRAGMEKDKDKVTRQVLKKEPKIHRSRKKVAKVSSI